MTNRSRLALYAALGAVVLLVYSSGSLAWLWTDWLWFESVRQGAVFRTLVGAKLGLGLGVGLLAAGVLYGAGRLALSRMPARSDPVVAVIQGAGTDSGGPSLSDTMLRRLILLLSVGVGVLHGLWAATRWEHALLFLNGGDFGFSDPIFGHDAAFYVFTLPLLDDLRGLLSTLVLLSGLVALAVYAVRGAVRLEVRDVDGRVVPQGMHIDPAARSHLSIVLGAFLVVWAVGIYLARYAVLYDQSGVIAGATYADVYGQIPLMTAQAIATAIGGMLLAAGIARSRNNLVLTGIGAIVAALIVARVYPDLLQRFSVLPNELNMEAPFIDHHIKATRHAFDLDRVEERNLSGDARLTLADVEANRATTQNVRLWDHGPLLDTFSQVQEIRTYYDFASVDNDRYMIDGELRQTMLSPRELRAASLPPQARTWVNETMIYTHGYGMALGPVNEVTEQGLPELFVKDLPPVIEHPDDLAITRPELYFGEQMQTPVFVNTRNEEFDYPSGEQNRYTAYDGEGGISLSSLFTRATMAMRLQSAMLLLTKDLTPESRVLLYRDIMQRASRVAPFLSFDRDPYMAIVDGRLMWILDAYTSSSRFPYSQRVSTFGNYLRNSAKITIDAFDGTMTFYMMDPEDPILAAWERVLPGLLTPAEQMPESVRAHLRYPQDYFSAQAALFAIYHMTNSQIFYNREDEWEVPAVDRIRMTPYYTIMRLPGEEREEFILMLPFVPRGKPNLAAWMVARSDGDQYGHMRVYKFPKDKMVYGPTMIVARINQNGLISEKLSLWNQQGSQVVLGTLLVIPIEESLIYVQPLYLRAESGSIPELKRVIVGYENEIAMEPTLDLALEKLFGRSADEREEAGEDASARRPGEALLQQADRVYERLQVAAAAGSWEEFGRNLDTLGATLDELLEEEDSLDDTQRQAESGMVEDERPTLPAD